MGTPRIALTFTIIVLLLILLPLGSNPREKTDVAASMSLEKQPEESLLTNAEQISSREEVNSSSVDSALAESKELPVETSVFPGSVHGIFLDYDGNPLKKERLYLLRPDGDIIGEGFRVYSDDNGYFSFAEIPPGDWWICWKPKRSEIITKLQNVYVESEKDSTTTLLLEGTRTVTGRISFNDKWSPSLDQGGIRLILSPAYGPDRESVVARGWAFTDLSKPDKSGSFTMAGLRPDLYILKVVPFDEGDHLTLEIDLTQADVKMEPVFIDPSTELIAGR
jgi:hypothetical protein